MLLCVACNPQPRGVVTALLCGFDDYCGQDGVFVCVCVFDYTIWAGEADVVYIVALYQSNAGTNRNKKRIKQCGWTVTTFAVKSDVED